MRMFILVLLCLCATQSKAQDSYGDSLNKYISNYVIEHEVVKGDDKSLFRFFPANENFRVLARFEKTDNGKWFTMETSGTIKKTFRVYGKISFEIDKKKYQLNLYQSQNLMQTQEFKDNLFLPFTDLNTGDETYEAGRYIDLKTSDIKGNFIAIDFNKAYNPYCAYVSGKYNCPIPPKENYLPVAIDAGEKNFGKHPN